MKREYCFLNLRSLRAKVRQHFSDIHQPVSIACDSNSEVGSVVHAQLQTPQCRERLWAPYRAYIGGGFMILSPRTIPETIPGFASLMAMLPLSVTPLEAAPEADELHSAAGPLAQTDFSALGVQVNIEKLLTWRSADLQAVEDAIQALESISPESRSKRFRGSSRPRPLTAQIPKPNNVVDIHTKRG